MEKRLSYSLLFIRLTIFVVMLMWTLDKFINPKHAAHVFTKFYMLENIGSNILQFIAIFQFLIIVSFLIGFLKKYSYGLVLLMHLVSTLSTFSIFLNPLKHLLFFAAWPMLAGALTLFLLRDYDNILTLKSKKL